MNNRELEDLLARKGTENEVTIRGADLRRLLALAFHYNFLADFVSHLSKQNFSEEKWRQMQKEFDRPFVDLVGYWLAIDAAKAAMEMHPPANWVGDIPADIPDEEDRPLSYKEKLRQMGPPSFPGQVS